MLTSETKRHIDAARQVLVGVVPNPASQIDQITNALIYKFMDDMDQTAIKSNDEPSFFVDELEKYSWVKLMDPRKGNQERMNLYTEALQKFSESEKLPPLFREIFKSAFLPYRSPEVLDLFLKEIAYFDYSHSEELGNAYEYLLSIMSSQGDAGQFRTPRYIIDFIVTVVDPRKDDRVLDPACGTAGFLISAYKHILEQHDGKYMNGEKNNKQVLSPDEKKALLTNFEGYDIDPGMVRIAQANMYLHNFKNPKIYNYNTLADEDRWGDKFDVILANPPFMSPRGSVAPHNKFTVESNRSEVLFVDYILSHLRPNGRAGIIVPEGIIFQSTIGHTQLRKNLIEDGLYSVVSLPSGIFQPYSGVKTSILFFDNKLTKNRDEILFVDIRDVGVSLGTAKKLIEKNDLIPAIELLKLFQKNEKIKPSRLAFAVKKSDFAEHGYDLSLNKYKKLTSPNTGRTFVKLSQVCRVSKGKSSSTKTTAGEYPLILTAEDQKTAEHYDFDGTGVCVPLISATGHGKAAIKRVHFAKGKFALANLLAFVEPKNIEELNPKYLYYCLDYAKDEVARLMKGAANVSMKPEDLANFEIPLLSIDEQNGIVDRLDGYQSIISGAENICDNWQPFIEIDPAWKKVKLSEVATVNNMSVDIDINAEYDYLDISSVENETGEISQFTKILGKDLPSRARRAIFIGDILVSTVRPNLKAFAYIDYLPENPVVSTGFAVISANNSDFSRWIYLILFSDFVQEQMISQMGKGAYPSINQTDVLNLEIPFPAIEVQQKIVDEILIEKAFIKGNKKLIRVYSEKKLDLLQKLWG